MADVGTLLMKVNADTKNFEKGISKAQKTMDGLKKAVKAAAVGMTAAFGAVSVKAIKLASDAEEMQNKFDVTFKTMSKDAESWAKTYSRSVGRSVNDTKKFISNIADLQQGLGMTEKESLELSKKIVELGTDLASFNNVNDATAIEAVQKAMLGEAESAKQLGLLLNVDRVKAFAEAQGKVWEEVTDVERAMLTYELAVTQSQNAIGDAERSSGSFENQMKALKSTLKDATTEFGMKLLPVVTKVVSFINENLVPTMDRMKTVFNDFAKRIQPIVAFAFEEIKRVMAVVYQFILTNVMPIFNDLVNLVKGIMPIMKDVIEQAITRAKDVMFTMWAFIKDNVLPIYTDLYNMIKNNMPQIKEFIVNALDFALKAFDALWAFVKQYILPIISSLLELVEAVFPTVWKVVKSAFDNIISLGTVLWEFFKNNLLPIIRLIFDTVNDVIPKLAPIFETAFGLIADAIAVITGIIEGLIKVISGLIDWIDNALGKLKEFFGFDGKSITVTQNTVEGRTKASTEPTNPRAGGGPVRGGRANGGSVMGGSSYLVGEKGPEIFTPSSGGMVTPSGGASVTININGTQDPNLIMNKVVDILNRQGITRR